MRMPSAVAGSVIYPLQARALRRPTFGYLAVLERSQWLDRSEVESLQVEKLRKLLQVAHTHSPWHRARMEAAELQPNVVNLSLIHI